MAAPSGCACSLLTIVPARRASCGDLYPLRKRILHPLNAWIQCLLQPSIGTIMLGYNGRLGQENLHAPGSKLSYNHAKIPGGRGGGGCVEKLVYALRTHCCTPRHIISCNAAGIAWALQENTFGFAHADCSGFERFRLHCAS